MAAPSVWIEDLCEKCRGLPWDCGYYSGYEQDRLIDHHKSLCKLGNSAKAGCRTCQIFWLYTMAETNAKMEDDFELRFAWHNEYYAAQIMIGDSSQSFTREECERYLENMSIERSPDAMGNQIRGDFGGGIRSSGGQVSMTIPNNTTSEGSTTMEKFVAHIRVDFESYSADRRETYIIPCKLNSNISLMIVINIGTFKMTIWVWRTPCRALSSRGWMSA